MENEEVDFDINNYGIEDLEYFFQLNEMPSYNDKDIEIKANEVQSQLVSSGLFDPKLKNGFNKFIQQGKKKLMEFKEKDEDVYKKKLLPKTPIIENGGRVIEKPKDTSFIYADPSEFYKGTLNPLNTRVLTYILNIDSRFREVTKDGSPSDFIVKLPMKYYKIASMEVSAIELPVAFYDISETLGNTYLYIDYEDSTTGLGSTNYKKVSIPEGNYTNSELVTALQDAFISLGPVYSDIIVTHNTVNDKVTLSTTNVTVLSFSIYFDRNTNGDVDNKIQLTTTLGANLGFIKSEYNNLKTYTGESILLPKTLNYLFLSVDEFQNNVNSNAFTSAFQNSFLDNNIIARITKKKKYESSGCQLIVNDELLTEKRDYFGPIDIERLRIRLFDEYGRIVNMNNVNFSFCLTLKQMYKL